MGALLLVALTTSAAGTRAPLDKPNIVMLFVDDLGYGDLGFTGNTMTHTPNIDRMAYEGKVLSSWYSGAPVCTASRAALLTGRQFTRVGVPGVFGDGANTGLPLNETTVADQLKKVGYRTAIMGKWHLGQRPMFLPGARGFDEYLGIPYSDDMGAGRRTPCPGQQVCASSPAGGGDIVPASTYTYTLEDNVHGTLENLADLNSRDTDDLVPLVHQTGGTTSTPGATTRTDGYAKNTTIVEQPLDFTTLGEKYAAFVLQFLDAAAKGPFFLYMPFSHVHTTAHNQPQRQYAGCAFQNTSKRGAFGDALAEVDHLVGEVRAKIERLGVEKNTLILFTGDNGPWMVQGLSGGSPGLLVGRYAGYWNTGKGSTWEGGIHEAAFAYWPGMITAGSRSSEVVSSLDLLPTASALAGVPLPTDRVYDGRDMREVLLQPAGKSPHDVLFFYGGAAPSTNAGPSAARMGCWKAHWGTGPGLSGCPYCPSLRYPVDAPLLFNVCIDPSEGIPMFGAENATFANGTHYKHPDPGPTPPGAVDAAEVAMIVSRLAAAFRHELATFTYGGVYTRVGLIAPDLLPGEVNATLRVCCDKDPFAPVPKTYSCDCDGAPFPGGTMVPIGSTNAQCTRS